MAGCTLKFLGAVLLVAAVAFAVAAYREGRGRQAARGTPAPPLPDPSAGSRPPAALRPPATPPPRSAPPPTPAPATPAPSPRPRTPVPRPEQHGLPRPPFAAGETLTYRASWSNLSAGHATLRVTDGSRPGTLRLVGEAATVGMAKALYDADFAFDVVCRADDLRPIEVRRTTREGDRSQTEAGQYHHERRYLETAGLRQPLDPRGYDPVSALYALRMLDLGPVGSASRLVVNDLGGRFDVTVEVIARHADRVELRLISVAPGAPSEWIATVVLESQGARRIRELRTALPMGEVLLTLDSP